MPEADLRKKALAAQQSAAHFAHIFSLIEKNQQCRTSKETLIGENFLLCTYLRENLEMLTLTQILGGILIIIVTIVGIPAIKKFEWAGKANTVRVVKAQRQENLKTVLTKRIL
jgi:hypothetical protein